MAKSVNPLNWEGHVVWRDNELVVIPPESSVIPTLTPREAEGLDHGSDGYTLGQVANKFYYSEENAKFHRGNLFRKLEARNMSHATRRAFELGLLAMAQEVDTDQIDNATPRQREVLICDSQGLTIPEVGAILNIAEQTVKFHHEVIYERLGAVNRPHAVRIGIETGIIPIQLHPSLELVAPATQETSALAA